MHGDDCMQINDNERRSPFSLPVPQAHWISHHSPNQTKLLVMQVAVCRLTALLAQVNDNDSRASFVYQCRELGLAGKLAERLARHVYDAVLDHCETVQDSWFESLHCNC